MPEHEPESGGAAFRRGGRRGATSSRRRRRAPDDAPDEPADAPADDAPTKADELTAEQAQELLDKVDEMRKKRSNGSFTHLGWKMTWSWRASHGDMCVIDPTDGSKIHSVIGLKRRLGLAPPQGVEDPSALPGAADGAAENGEGSGEGGEASSAAAGPKPLPPHDLSDAQIEELITAIEQMRRRNKNTDEYVHGWRLIYTLRGGNSSTRGDMTAIDPRDGQKIFSLVGVRRKLDSVEDVWDEAVRKAKESLPEDLQGKRRRAHGGLDMWNDPVIPGERGKRQRNVVNYADAGTGRGTFAGLSGFRMSDLILSAVDEHASALAKALTGKQKAAAPVAAAADGGGEAAGASASMENGHEESGKEAAAPSDDSALEVFAGVDMLTLASAVHTKQRRANPSSNDHVPLGTVRHTVSSLLRSGRLRRRLANPSFAAGKAEKTTAYYLKMLVLNSLQIEDDEGAPWCLPKVEEDGGMMAAAKAAKAAAKEAAKAAAKAAKDDDDDSRSASSKSSQSDDEDDEEEVTPAERMHVWKGVTPPHLPSLRGVGLVGRKVEVWWSGDATFYPALVTGYNERPKATGYADAGMGTHMLLYESGLRCIEHLEGPGEPLVWRLLEEDGTTQPPRDLPDDVFDPSVEEEMEVAMQEDDSEEEDDEDDDVPPPIMVTLKGPEGCMPVGTIGTAAYKARRSSKRQRRRQRRRRTRRVVVEGRRRTRLRPTMTRMTALRLLARRSSAGTLTSTGNWIVSGILRRCWSMSMRTALI